MSSTNERVEEKDGRKRRERERDCRRDGRGYVVGALNPFKYNQYRGEDAFHPLGYMDMIFTVHSRITRKP